MSRAPSVVAVGECTRDWYLDLGAERVGGISVNFAIGARRAGAASAVVSCAGSDRAGDAIGERLAAEEIDATHLHRASGPTATQEIRILPNGEREFPAGGYHPGVLATFALGADDLQFIGRFDLVAAPYFAQIEHLFWPAIRAAKPGSLRVADLLDGADLGPELAGLEPLAGIVELAFLSGDRGTVERLAPCSARHPEVVFVVTHGSDGSTALSKGTALHQPAVAVPLGERVDTTGCGDAFQAAFAVGYFRGEGLAPALRAGAAAAARVIRHLGATEIETG
jgi:fructoselysine 6-kinase